MTGQHDESERPEADSVAGAQRAPDDPPDAHNERGTELARMVARGLAGRTPAVRRRARGLRKPLGTTLSGAKADERDPQTLDATLGRFVAEHGWDQELRVHGVFSRWAAIVGDEVSAHVTPESFADQVVFCRADSTAWATQMKLLAPDLVRRLNEVLGEQTVLRIEVRGPHAPRWSRGRLRVKGRGPRDTYG